MDSVMVACLLFKEVVTLLPSIKMVSASITLKLASLAERSPFITIELTSITLKLISAPLIIPVMSVPT